MAVTCLTIKIFWQNVPSLEAVNIAIITTETGLASFAGIAFRFQGKTSLVHNWQPSTDYCSCNHIYTFLCRRLNLLYDSEVVLGFLVLLLMSCAKVS